MELTIGAALVDCFLRLSQQGTCMGHIFLSIDSVSGFAQLAGERLK